MTDLERDDREVSIQGHQIDLRTIEAQLKRHACVKQARVVARGDGPGEQRLVGYVVVDLPALKAARHATARNGTEMVDHWRDVYEQAYSAVAAQPSFLGWNSSYTGEPIPESDMQAWLSSAVERIRALKPRRVLEIGCGVGLIVEQLAGDCETYLATDFSAEALQRLGSWLENRRDLQHVQLRRAAALELDELHPGSFDTVVLNSVVQYFPDLDYLCAVLERAAGWVCRGGHVFVGDIRHHGLLELFHSSVQLAHADEDLTLRQLRTRISQAIELDPELVVDPGFFSCVGESIPGIARAEVFLKRGCAENELTRYRYDAVLHVGEPVGSIEAEPLQWRGRQETLLCVQERLRSARARRVLVAGIPNRRLSQDLTAASLIATGAESVTVAELRRQVQLAQVCGEDPEDFWTAGADNGYVVRVGWPSRFSGGEFEVEWTLSADADVHSRRANTNLLVPGRVLSNDPLGKSLQRGLVRQLLEYLKEQLPPYMIPAALVVLDEIGPVR